ncbi:MAG TPA: hypothetical protein VHI13_12440 [Candidatus Kapabacteria bacterium]|nr:hypothetical protein [Candidatus Kapabacteria bacterium]
MQIRTSLLPLIVSLILPLSCTLFSCTSSRSTTSEARREGSGRDESAGEVEDEEDEEREHGRPAPPLPWGAGIRVESAEGGRDTVHFHLGAPLFLRLKVAPGTACAPFQGKPFFFEESGAQLGWGFEEVADSVLFPQHTGSCERIIMLSSESSNRLPSGSFTFKTMIFGEDGTRWYSDTIALVAERVAGGADSVSYARFLQEQIVRNSPLLADPETVRALFADGTPRSAESEVYRAVILYRIGDAAGAERALASAKERAAARLRPLDAAAAGAAERVDQLLHGVTRR